MGMAKRKYSKHTKIEPAMQTLYFAYNAPAGNSSSYIDLSQVASLVNRRFYRQGINWAVAGFKFLTTSNFQGAIGIHKLPNTWTMSNSWEKGFRTWQRMNREALAETESVRPKFLDFKIYADADHHAAGYGANLLPLAQAGVYAPGEWEPSKFVIPKTDGTDQVHNREVIAVGASYPPAGASGLGAVSLIEGYAASRALPDVLDPNVPDDAADAEGNNPENWMVALFNDGTEQDDQILNDMISENNVAPYPFENGPIVGGGTYGDTQYPGGANQGTGLQVHDYEYVTATTIGGTSRLKGGNFPCGLIRIDTTSSGEVGGWVLTLDLIPGDHRGYLCEPMTEM